MFDVFFKILSASRRHFEIAFRMFDLNGDGDVDVEEFEKVTALIRQRTSIGARHREHSVSVNSLRVRQQLFGNKLHYDRIIM